MRKLSNEAIVQRLAAITAHAGAGLTMKNAAAEMGLSYVRLTRLAKLAGIKFARKGPRVKRQDYRADKMREMWVASHSLAEIGKTFNITRERARQILNQAFGKLEGGTKILRDQAKRRSRETFPPQTKNYVYLIEAQNGMVKIGNSACPANRINFINLHSPIPCRLIAVWNGSIKDELKFHKRFDEHRAHCEWFFAKGSLSAFVETHRGVGLIEKIVDWETIVSPDRKLRKAEGRAKAALKLKQNWCVPGYREAQKQWRQRLRDSERERFYKTSHSGNPFSIEAA